MPILCQYEELHPIFRLKDNKTPKVSLKAPIDYFRLAVRLRVIGRAKMETCPLT